MGSISFASVYDNSSLPGECLIKPFKNYRFFFLSQESVLWKLAHCISGLVMYPILGAFALIGMFFKYMSIQETSRHERIIQTVLDRNYTGLTVNPIPGRIGGFSVIRP